MKFLELYDHYNNQKQIILGYPLKLAHKRGGVVVGCYLFLWSTKYKKKNILIARLCHPKTNEYILKSTITNLTDNENSTPVFFATIRVLLDRSLMKKMFNESQKNLLTFRGISKFEYGNLIYCAPGRSAQF